MSIKWHAILHISVVYLMAIEVPLSMLIHRSIDGILAAELVVMTGLGLTLEWRIRKRTGWKEWTRMLVHLPWDLVLLPFGSSGHLLRLTRLLSLIHLDQRLPRLLFTPSLTRTSIRVLYIGMVIPNALACGWIFVGSQPRDFAAYTNALYWALTTLTTVGYGDIVPKSLGEKWFTMLTMVLGVGLYALVIGHVTQILEHGRRRSQELQEQVSGINQWMQRYHIPSALRQQVIDFVQHLHQKSSNNREERLLAMLPQVIQQELSLYVKINALRASTLFDVCKNETLRDLAQAIEQIYCAPGDKIITKGELGQEMFVLAHGQAQVVNEQGESIAILGEGKFFGEVALIEDTPRMASVVAQSYCDLYVLKQEAVHRAFQSDQTFADHLNRHIAGLRAS